MSFLTAKSLPRRTVLRGLGATVALPLLDAMLPAFSLRGRAAASRCTASRRSMCRTAWPWSTGRRRARGPRFELSPILEPLAPFRNQMLVLSGIKASWNYIHAAPPGRFSPARRAAGGTRSRSSRTCRWTSCSPGSSPRETQVASLELSMDAPNNAGACTGNLSCAYTHTLSWRSPTQPLPMEYNPRAVFEKLFGDSGSTERAAREARLRQHKSILDSVTEKLAEPEAGARAAGSGQGRRIRGVDSRRRAAHSEGRGAERHRAADDRAAAGRAAGVRGSPGADARPAAAGASVRPDARHLVHDRQGAERPAVSADRRARGAPSAVASRRRAGARSRSMSKINRYHTRALLAVPGEAARDARRRRLAARSHDDPYGSGISNSTRHSGDNLPLLVVGGGAGRLKGGRHLTYAGQAVDGEPAGDADGQAGRAGRAPRRQHRQAADRYARRAVDREATR